MPFDSAALPATSNSVSNQDGMLETLARFEQTMQRLDATAERLRQELDALNGSTLLKTLRSLQITVN